MVVDKIRGDQDSRDEKEEREDDEEAAPPYREPEEEEQEGRYVLRQFTYLFNYVITLIQLLIVLWHFFLVQGVLSFQMTRSMKKIRCSCLSGRYKDS